MSFSLRATVDLRQIPNLDRSEPLRAAVVRDGRVLASALIDLEKTEKGEIPIEIPFAISPGERPLGVELRVGPDGPESVFATHKDVLALRPSKAALREAAEGAIFDLGRHVITSSYYGKWLKLCRTYVVTGRLVRRVTSGDTICEQPVPNATVELYDVDRVGFWYRKDLIRSVHTDANGHFTARFRWCCAGRAYRPFDGWALDWVRWHELQGILERIGTRVTGPLPTNPNPPDPPSITAIVERVFAADVASAAVMQAPMLEAARPVLSLVSKQLSRSSRAAIAELRAKFPPAIWRDRLDCSPDLLFRATQARGGGTVVVYDESVWATRWDISAVPAPHDVGTLRANDQAFSVDVCTEEQRPDGDCVWFSDVGLIKVSQIHNIDDVGATAALAGFTRGSDYAFGGTVSLFGLFGAGSSDPANPSAYVDYYKLQYAPWDGNPANLPLDTAFNDVPVSRLGAVSRDYLAPGGPITTSFGPTTVGTLTGLYRTLESFQRSFTGPPGPWGWLWSVGPMAAIDTNFIPGGLVVFRVVGYRQVGTALIPRVMQRCIEPIRTELLPLHIDNRPITRQTPGFTDGDVAILSVETAAGNLTDFTCKPIKLTQGDTLTVHFRAQDLAGHLGHFSLTEYHRLGCASDLLPPHGTLLDSSLAPGDSSYGGHLARTGSVRPIWNGDTYSVAVTVGHRPSPTAACNDCADGSFFVYEGAYDLRLVAWKRVTNGYGDVYWTETDALFVVDRTEV